MAVAVEQVAPVLALLNTKTGGVREGEEGGGGEHGTSTAQAAARKRKHFICSEISSGQLLSEVRQVHCRIFNDNIFPLH